MKALILSAGQGKRLLPLTENLPKCLLPIRGKALIHWQLDALAKAGCPEAVVVVGFGAVQVEKEIATRPDAARIRTIYNPFYAVSNNLASCWIARDEMDGDFLIMNGDVVFQDGILQRVFAASDRPISVAVNVKESYDDDDMKVHLDGRRLARVGKTLPPKQTDGEAIGLHAFRGKGPEMFLAGLEQALRRPGGLDRWYLTVIDELARTHYLGTASVTGLDWAEIDTQEDLAHARALVAGWLGDVSVAPA